MYQLYIANKNYSSWSLRPWVLMKTLGIDFQEHLEPFESADNYVKFRKFSPTGRVPCLEDGDNLVWDSLAISEYLAERHIEVWPENQNERTFARCAAAEMHSGFDSLRNVCPMNCAIEVEMTAISPSLQRDIDRLDELWCEGLSRFNGPYLSGGAFTAADAFFCPVAFRIRSYGLPLSAAAANYCQLLLKLPAMKQWDQAAVQESWREEQHEQEAAMAGRIVLDRRLS